MANRNDTPRTENGTPNGTPYTGSSGLSQGSAGTPGSSSLSSGARSDAQGMGSSSESQSTTYRPQSQRGRFFSSAMERIGQERGERSMGENSRPSSGEDDPRMRGFRSENQRPGDYSGGYGGTGYLSSSGYGTGYGASGQYLGGSTGNLGGSTGTGSGSMSSDTTRMNQGERDRGMSTGGGYAYNDRVGPEFRSGSYGRSEDQGRMGRDYRMDSDDRIDRDRSDRDYRTDRERMDRSDRDWRSERVGSRYLGGPGYRREYDSSLGGEADTFGYEAMRTVPSGREVRSRWLKEPLYAHDVMTRSPKTVAPESTLREAAEVMKNEDTGIVPVVDAQGRLQGVLTDRDLVVRAFAFDKVPGHMRVEEIMSDEVEAVTQDESVQDILELMGRKQIRRVPVVDRDDRLIGIISMGDIAQKADTDEQLQEALQRISGKRSFWRRLFS